MPASSRTTAPLEPPSSHDHPSSGAPARRRPTRGFWRDNGLSLVLSALFLLMTAGQAAAGFCDDREDRLTHGRPAIALSTYLHSGAFGEALFENWESEFLQMGLYVLLTSFLFQRGSAESNDPDHREDEPAPNPRSPAPVRRGGLARLLYSHSLSAAFFLLFALSMAGHALCGRDAYNDEAHEHGQAPITLWGYVTSSRFWFESLQNWQSEFLAMLSIVLLSIWLREKGSAESKKLTSAHRDTGK